MDTSFDTTSLAEHDLWAAVGGLEAAYLAGDMPEPEPTRSSQAAPAAADPTLLAGRLDLPAETRALWVTRWDFRTPDDIRWLVDKAAGANFNTLYFQVRGNADAMYSSTLEPWMARLSGGALGQDPGWDPLAVAIDEAHSCGLELHAWINVYPAWMGETPPAPVEPEPMFSRFNRLFGDQWVVWDRHQQPMQLNKTYLWSNPGHGAVLEHIASVGYDIVDRYCVDGLHLDNVRYPGWEYSRDPITLEAVAQAQAQEPDLDRKEWQRRQVNQMVARLHAGIQRLKPGLPLSAAVWPVYLETWEWWSAGDGYDGYCQDSVGWVHEQIAELICPMLYLASITTDDAQFQALVEDFVARAGGEHVVAGITATYDDFATIGRRIDLARTASCAGQAIFSYGHVNQRGYWEQFKQGPYASPARPLLPSAHRQRISELLRHGEGTGWPEDRAIPTAGSAPT
jgi:uncharacterized lipoprotein YddW (UPF0748 family)